MAALDPSYITNSAEHISFRSFEIRGNILRIQKSNTFRFIFSTNFKYLGIFSISVVLRSFDINNSD